MMLTLFNCFLVTGRRITSREGNQAEPVGGFLHFIERFSRSFLHVYALDLCGHRKWLADGGLTDSYLFRSFISSSSSSSCSAASNLNVSIFIKSCGMACKEAQ